MRRYAWCVPAVGLIALVAGCGSELFPGSNNLLPVLGTTYPEGAEEGATSPTSDSTAGLPVNSSATIRGSVYGTGDYELFDLGAGSAGDVLSVAGPGLSLVNTYFTVVLFDEDYNLIMRKVMGSSSSMSHTLREYAPHVYVGVAPSSSGIGGEFQFSVSHRAGAVPAPNPQVVWLNFGGAQNLSVHRRSGISFSAFRGSMVGDDYVGETQAVKEAIIAAMRADYAGFNVQIYSSDDGLPPAGSYSTIHFGSSDTRLLGLADSIDHYNGQDHQNAIIYVESFAMYYTMRLEPDEMGLMIGNVASHELGHLLGLYHTCDPDAVMDTTGSAWDLAEDQSFKRAPLDPSVFPMGMEDCPTLLAQAVGGSAITDSQLDKPGTLLEKSGDTLKAQRRAMVRDLARIEISHRCGLCLSMDDPPDE